MILSRLLHNFRVLSIVSSIETLGDILRDVIGYIDDVGFG
jgi:hypothetical protein